MNALKKIIESNEPAFCPPPFKSGKLFKCLEPVTTSNKCELCGWHISLHYRFSELPEEDQDEISKDPNSD